MKIKPEYEKEMIDRIIADLETSLLLLQNVSMSLALVNNKDICKYSVTYKEENIATIDKAYNITYKIYHDIRNMNKEITE